MNRKTDLLLNWRFMTPYPGWAYVSLGRNFVLLTYLRHQTCDRSITLLCHRLLRWSGSSVKLHSYSPYVETDWVMICWSRHCFNWRRIKLTKLCCITHCDMDLANSDELTVMQTRSDDYKRLLFSFFTLHSNGSGHWKLIWTVDSWI